MTLDGGKLRVDVTADLNNSITFNADKTSTLSAATGQTVTLTGNSVTLGANAVAQFGSATDTGTIVYAAGATADPTSSIVVAGGTLRDSGGSLVGLTFGAASTTVNAGARARLQRRVQPGDPQPQGRRLGRHRHRRRDHADLLRGRRPRSSTFGGTISGPGAVMVQTFGTGGTMIFTGANTYTGGTTICACTTLQLGTLLAAGSIVGEVFNEGIFNVVNSNTTPDHEDQQRLRRRDALLQRHVGERGRDREQ